jgi:decaprenylphospho-beta-D-ribofuranose 2-oxidase
MKKKISNWGMYPKVSAEIISAPTQGNIPLPSSSFIARGLGRSYGDASLASTILDCTARNQILNFDSESGIIFCEAGVSLRQISEATVPHGWFLAVTPGTANVTVGGAISADVHGKNHFAYGTFTNFVTELNVQFASGEMMSCSEKSNRELFDGICGGMGLLAIIVSAKIQLQKISSAYFVERTAHTNNISSLLKLITENTEEFCVAWMNAYTNNHEGVLFTGHYATEEESKKIPSSDLLKVSKQTKWNVPFVFPIAAMNGFTMKRFNKMYQGKNQEGEKLKPYSAFHYPLDGLQNWNRLYGPKGMLQYQFVLPDENAVAGISEISRMMKKENCESYLAVLKRFGDEKRLLSFPMRGICVALDFPVSEKVFALMNKMDEVIVNARGRFYLAKDARMSREVFLKTQPRIEEFLALKKKLDPKNNFSSLQSKRLFGV